MIYLAPMEGVIDFPMRHLLTEIGGYDVCVTEFLRVTNFVHSDRIFLRHCPELKDGSVTLAQTPVVFQLMGSDLESLAQTAELVVNLGAKGIDLNFGCPAKKVNNHDGGASLLRAPQRIESIIRAVRCKVPSHIPFSAKIRLGYEDKELALENAHAAHEGGADVLVVHARTKKEGYRPPAHWDWIAKINDEVSMPIVANGDIWSLEDYIRCRAQTGCQDVMLGRGAVACPDLALQIKAYLHNEEHLPFDGSQVPAWLLQLFVLCTGSGLQHSVQYPMCRVKQWCQMLARRYPQAQALFQVVKKTQDPKQIERILKDGIAFFQK